MPAKRRSMADFLAEQRAIEDPLAGDPRPGLAAVPASEVAVVARLRPDQVAPTPLNARSNFGTAEELGELGESMRVRQLQPVVVVTRADYLRLWPEHEDQVPAEAGYVLVNGERRWRAAAQVSLPALDALVRPELTGSRPAFLDAIFTENLDRRNLDPIEEARAVEEMVTECGSAALAATRFRRHESWVSQRRALLKLTPALQDHVRSGELPVRIARSIAALPAGNQETAWRETRETEQGRREGRRQARDQESRGNPSGRPRQDPAEDFTAVKNPGPGTSANGTSAGGRQSRPDATVMRWDDIGKVAQAIRAALGAEDRRQLAAMILDD